MILLLGGCSTNSTQRPMTVSVRDGLTHRPIPGALVRVSSVHFHIPLWSNPKLDSIPYLASQAVTDEKGREIMGANALSSHQDVDSTVPPRQEASLVKSIGTPG